MTAAGPHPDPPAPEESETDRLARQVTGPGDHVGMTALWRITMGLELWWFIALGEEGQEAPAAATIDDQEMILAFTSDERAHHFAVQQGLIDPTGTLTAFAVSPEEIVAAADTYERAGVAGLMFDPHLSGYFIPCEQLPVVREAVMSTADDTDEVSDQG